MLGRARWQIELLFKLWKQHGHLDQTRSVQPWRVLTEIYAKLTALLIQHWMLLLGCWPRANRSLTRAAQTIRLHAVGLACAGACKADLVAALQALVRWLDAGGRIAKRKAKPSAFQLWLNPTLIGLT